MFSAFWANLNSWTYLDTWIASTAALAAMSCALPGVFLLLRRQAMMGDALSHSMLPGIVLGYLVSSQLFRGAGGSSTAVEYLFLLGGALIAGLGAGALTEVVQRLGRTEANAALGVVFTTLFALGLLLLRLVADRVHLDPGCILYGNLEISVVETWWAGLPKAIYLNAVMLVLNLLLIAVFYKELLLSTFDPPHARVIGLPVVLIQQGLMAATAATLVTAFESVGSILVIAMLIVPAATATLLARRLPAVLGISLAVAAVSGVLGHAAAITLPGPIFARLGMNSVTDVSTTGSMALASGVCLLAAMAFAPQSGWVPRQLNRWRLSRRFAAEDILGVLYRYEESGRLVESGQVIDAVAAAGTVPRWLITLALRSLISGRRIQLRGSVPSLTEIGRNEARQLVRSHRLWETYVGHHLGLPDTRLHASAERAEHYINPNLREELAKELREPAQDPQGRHIPPESTPSS